MRRASVGSDVCNELLLNTPVLSAGQMKLLKRAAAGGRLAYRGCNGVPDGLQGRAYNLHRRHPPVAA